MSITVAKETLEVLIRPIRLARRQRAGFQMILKNDLRCILRPRPAPTMTPQRSYTIAVLPGDGIGVEVMPPALRCLEAAASRFGFQLEFRSFPWASCTYYLEHGKMLPDDWKTHLQACDAIYFGAGLSR